MRTLRMVVSVVVVGVFSSGVVVRGENLGTGFTYQGELERNGALVTDYCDFEFSLWDQEVGGINLGTDAQTVEVDGGRFTVEVDFGAAAITGEARWLKTNVCCPSACAPAYSELTPRQKLTPAPHALALPGLRTEQDGTSPNVIGGYSGNTVDPAAYGATISGGGESGHLNTVSASFATIGGGYGNQGNDWGATVGGGYENHAIGDWSTIGGGYENQATGSASTIGGGQENQSLSNHSTVSGGQFNSIYDHYGTIGGGGDNRAGTDDGDTTTQVHATVSGGADNTASANYSTIGGGQGNIAFDNSGTIGGGGSNQTGSFDGDPASSSYATVGGGSSNIAGAPASTIAGGTDNEATNTHSTISGGESNKSNGAHSSVGGGLENWAMNDHATIAGGANNYTMSVGATVGGGEINQATGVRSTVPGGLSNNAGGDYSLAAGRRAKANNHGMFVWADSNDLDFPPGADPNFTPAANQFLARTTGGAVFVTGIDGGGGSTAGAVLPSGGGSWSSLSDRNLKSNVRPVRGRDILNRLGSLSISMWNYNAQPASTRHIGPMAQDFAATFGVGEDERFITGIDADGVALAAIQGLHEIVQEKEEEMASLKDRIAALEKAVAAITQKDGGKRGAR